MKKKKKKGKCLSMPNFVSEVIPVRSQLRKIKDYLGGCIVPETDKETSPIR